MPANSQGRIINFPSEDPPPVSHNAHVCKQSKDMVIITGGFRYPLRTFLLIENDGCDSAFLACVVAHQEKTAQAQIIAERSRDGWGRVRHSIPVNSPAVIAPPSVLEEYLISRYETDGFPAGILALNPENEHPAQAKLPALFGEAVLIAGQRGSGKSTGRMELLRRFFDFCWDSERVKKPGFLVFDAHGDDLGRVQVLDGSVRRGLINVLPKSAVVVLDSKNFQCRITDLPTDILIQSLGKLSGPQETWCKIYCSGRNDHQNLLNLLLHDPSQWAEDFPKISSDGTIPQSRIESLSALRARLNGLLVPPLFEPVSRITYNAPKTDESKIMNWNKVIDLLYGGKVCIVDVPDFPELQRSLLVTLLVRATMFKQYQSVIQRRPLHPIVIAGDEMHQYKVALDLFDKLFLEARKFFLSPVFSSQELSHFSTTIIDNATTAIIFRAQGKTLDATLRRFPQAKLFSTDIPQFPRGCGLFVHGGSLAVPVQFKDLT